MLFRFTTLFIAAAALYAQQPPAPQSSESRTASTSATAKPQDTEVWGPLPEVVTPGADCNAPAIKQDDRAGGNESGRVGVSSRPVAGQMDRCQEHSHRK